MAIGGLWRAMQAEVIKLQENDRCLLNKRINEGQFPLQNVRYACQDGEREHDKSHAGLFAACKRVALKELASLSVTRKETVKAAHAFILPCMELGCNKCGGAFPPGGEFSEDNLQKHPKMASRLQMAPAKIGLTRNDLQSVD